MPDQAVPDGSWTAARLATAIAVPATLIAAAVAFWLLGGFSSPTPEPTPTSTASSTASSTNQAQPTSPVTMPAPTLDPATAATCSGLVAKLPETVRDQRRRPVTAGSEQNAAYGEPPLTLACGTAPVTVASTEQVYGMSGVCWARRPVAGGSAWTTVDRVVPVTVTVPGSEDGQWAAEFSAVLAATVPRATTAPSGCP